MVHDIWNIRLGVDLNIPMEIDAKLEFVGPNRSRMRSFFSSLTDQPRYVPLNHSNWR